jgi:hypothetical protein
VPWVRMIIFICDFCQKKVSTGWRTALPLNWCPVQVHPTQAPDLGCSVECRGKLAGRQYEMAHQIKKQVLENQDKIDESEKK